MYSSSFIKIDEVLQSSDSIFNVSSSFIKIDEVLQSSDSVFFEFY